VITGRSDGRQLLLVPDDAGNPGGAAGVRGGLQRIGFLSAGGTTAAGPGFVEAIGGVALIGCPLLVGVALFWTRTSGPRPSRSSTAGRRFWPKGRFGTDRDGYAAMLKLGRQHSDRVWRWKVATASAGTPDSRLTSTRAGFAPGLPRSPPVRCRIPGAGKGAGSTGSGQDVKRSEWVAGDDGFARLWRSRAAA